MNRAVMMSGFPKSRRISSDTLLAAKLLASAERT
jgi:hypothetical protein